MTLVQIHYALTFDAPFHLGTGISTGMVDRTVIRNADGYLYVPASTLKGVVREHCEQLYHFYTANDQNQAISSRVPSPHNAKAALKDFGGPQTLISRIFGSPLYPGTLRFKNAEQTDINIYESRDLRNEDKGKYKDMQTSVLTQVRIDRQTRTAVDQALYTSEFGLSHLTFVGTIKGQLYCTPIDSLKETVHNEEKTYTLTPSYSLLLLLAGLLLLERIGGNKSTGKGQCSCRIEEVRLDRMLCPEAVWQGWIQRLDVLSKYSDVQPGGQA
jgi:CRISPR/Cas system CMR subunit Cmr4 (Cas7 group RAMP superfamily)